MAHPRNLWWLWATLWLAAAAVTAAGATTGLDRTIGTALQTVGRAVPATNLVWVFGGLPITLLAVVVAATRRRRGGWLVIGGFVAGLLIEVIGKHFIATPFPQATPEPAFYRHLESATNLTPQLALHWIGAIVKLPSHAGAHHALFRGSFPSGHVFRITYATGALLKSRRQWTWAIAAAAGFLVVATGGHWAGDVVGGFLLARWWLALADPVRVRP
ncbi:MAG: phosphatase PAP2 family protein [Firmicutes bacterium]|nr:phosphatase PAP2 family protein [Bacillota bacterium]